MIVSANTRSREEGQGGRAALLGKQECINKADILRPRSTS